MDKTRVDLNGRVSRVIILVGDGLGCQPLDVQALCRLQQRWQLRVIDADLAAINKLQERLQIACRNAGQHHDRMLACCILRRKSGEPKIYKSHISWTALRNKNKEWASEPSALYSYCAHTLWMGVKLSFFPSTTVFFFSYMFTLCLCAPLASASKYVRANEAKKKLESDEKPDLWCGSEKFRA